MAEAKDLGVHGQVFEIAEKDLLEEIESKLLQLQKEGKLEEIQQQHIAQARKTVERPKAVEGLTKAKHFRV